MGILDFLSSPAATGAGALMTGAGMIGSGLANTFFDFKNYNYMKDMQKDAWDREDTAVQRRMQDLQDAGLSKTLAAGSGASTSGPIRLDSPGISENLTGAVPAVLTQVDTAMRLLRQRKEIDQTAASTKLLDAQRLKALEDIKFMQENNPQRITAAELANQQKQAMMQDTIKNLALDVQKKGFEQTLQSTNKALLEAKLSDAEWKNTLQILRQEQEFNDLSVGKQELIAKQIAIELARIKVEDSKRNLEIYKDTGTPSNQALGQFTNLGVAGAQGLKGIWNKLFGGN